MTPSLATSNIWGGGGAEFCNRLQKDWSVHHFLRLLFWFFFVFMCSVFTFISSSFFCFAKFELFSILSNYSRIFLVVRKNPINVGDQPLELREVVG